jgi:protocatechuate 3,4-dioxygenase alpha subunit
MGLTPFQTIGPFFDVLLRTRAPRAVVSAAVPGERVVVTGALLDGDGRPIDDGLIETWQADASGRYGRASDARSSARESTFRGDAWSATDAEGRFRIETIRPGPVSLEDGRVQAPHLVVGVLARGILTRYVTRIYFDADPANAADPILAMVPADRRNTLIATRTSPGEYQFNIRIQGQDETVFFDV